MVIGRTWKRILLIVVTILVMVSLVGCQSSVNRLPGDTPAITVTVAPEENATQQINSKKPGVPADEKLQVQWGQRYTSQTEVAAYIHTYHVLPPNYITKAAAQKLGWDSSKGNLWQVTDHMSIGGDRFGNQEGLLPSAQGRQYYECDVNYAGGYRGAERIIYSNDGLIFYTRDHYKSYTQLY